MNTWGQEVDLLVRKCLDSATNVLARVEIDCEQNQMDFSTDFIDTFYSLLEERFKLTSGDNQWKWKTKIANKNLMPKTLNNSNGFAPIQTAQKVARVPSDTIRSPTSTTVSPPNATQPPITPNNNATFTFPAMISSLYSSTPTTSAIASTSRSLSPLNTVVTPTATASTLSTGSAKSTPSPARATTSLETPPKSTHRKDVNGAQAPEARANRTQKRKRSPEPKDASKTNKKGKTSEASKAGRKPGKAQRKVPGKADRGSASKENAAAAKAAQKSTPELNISTENTSSLNSFTYYCAHCHHEYNGSHQYDTVDKVYEHWQQRHNNEENFLPFRYHAVDMVTCYHCDFIGVYQGVKDHHAAEHPDKPFIVVSLSDADKCALCAFITVDMVAHFAERHKISVHANDFNPTAMTDRCLEELLHTNHCMRFKCSGCSRYFNAESQVLSHIEQHHPGSAVYSSPVQYRDIQSIIMPCCDQTEIQYNNLLKHIRSHEREYKCPECEFTVNNMFEVYEHYNASHSAMPPMDLAAHVKQLLEADYLATRVIFGTGLVVTKQNLLNTRYDDSHEFDEFLDSFIQIKQELVNNSNDEEI